MSTISPARRESRSPPRSRPSWRRSSRRRRSRSWPSCTAPSSAPRSELLGRARGAPGRARRRRAARLPARDARRSATATGRVAPMPADLQDRRVEITGPVDRKMIINALNSGANVFMADFEDANTPTWDNNDRRARSTCATRSARTIDFTSPEGQALRAEREDRRRCSCARAAGTCSRSTCCVDGEPVSGGTLRLRPVLLPQREGAARARQRARTSTCPRWRATSRRGCGTTSSSLAQDELGIPHGTIRATVLIETILAAFEMDEILYELREHSAGLNCGRWDYIFSCIKKFRSRPRLRPRRPRAGHDDHALPARLRAAADQDLPPPRRPRDGRHGGADPDQERPGGQRGGAREGARRQGARGERRPRRHLGRAPGPGADREGGRSTRVMPGPNQIDRKREDVDVTRARTCSTFVPEGPITEAGPAHEHQRRHPVPRRLARRQRLRADLQPDGGRRDRRDLARAGLAVDPLAEGRARRRPQGRRRARSARSSPRSWTRSTASYPENLHEYFDRAAQLFDDISTSDDFVDFLTLPAYQMID